MQAFGPVPERRIRAAIILLGVAGIAVGIGGRVLLFSILYGVRATGPGSDFIAMVAVANAISSVESLLLLVGFLLLGWGVYMRGAFALSPIGGPRVGGWAVLLVGVILGIVTTGVFVGSQLARSALGFVGFAAQVLATVSYPLILIGLTLLVLPKPTLAASLGPPPAPSPDGRNP